MTNEQEYKLLTMVKVDLGITTDAYNGRLGLILRSAAAMITREGITLDLDDIEDSQLVVMYAAWTWRKRDYTAKYAGDAGGAMPRMLRYALNNRLFSQKAGETND